MYSWHLYTAYTYCSFLYVCIFYGLPGLPFKDIIHFIFYLFNFDAYLWSWAKLKGPKRIFVVVGGESFWNEQKMFSMEQKMFLEQNYGIELHCVALYGFV